MIISRKRDPTKSALHVCFGSTKLAEKKELELRILGVTIDSKLAWAKHISKIKARAGRKPGALKKVANKLNTKGRASVYISQIKARAGQKLGAFKQDANKLNTYM